MGMNAWYESQNANQMTKLADLHVPYSPPGERVRLVGHAWLNGHVGFCGTCSLIYARVVSKELLAHIRKPLLLFSSNLL